MKQVEFKLIGYISGDTFGRRGNSHFSNTDGFVICGTKNRFGMDCSIEIRFIDLNNFETDESISFKESGTSALLRKNHLPITSYITCKKCLKALNKLIEVQS